MRQCPFCGHQNQNKDFFCVHCGELLPPRLSVARIVRNFFGVALVYTSFVMFALCERHGVCVFIGIGCIIGSIALFRRSKRERQEKKLLKSRNSQRKNTPAKVNEAPRESISQAQCGTPWMLGTIRHIAIFRPNNAECNCHGLPTSAAMSR